MINNLHRFAQKLLPASPEVILASNILVTHLTHRAVKGA